MFMQHSCNAHAMLFLHCVVLVSIFYNLNGFVSTKSNPMPCFPIYLICFLSCMLLILKYVYFCAAMFMQHSVYPACISLLILEHLNGFVSTKSDLMSCFPVYCNYFVILVINLKTCPFLSSNIDATFMQHSFYAAWY